MTDTQATEAGSAELPVDSYKDAAPYLRRPFTPQAVKFKVQATWDGGALIVPYIDARLAIERLNLVCPHLWTDKYEPTAQGLMWCHLTVDGITRSDVGTEIGQGDAGKKGLVSDALKRAAVKFGIGVSLYAMPKLRVSESDGHLRKAKQDKYALTPNGETHCRKLYEGWLDTKGKQAFGGEPLDHGDADDSVGDAEVESSAPAAPKLDPERVSKIVGGFKALKLPYKEIGVLLGSCGIDGLAANTPEAIQERVAGLSEAQADALEVGLEKKAQDDAATAPDEPPADAEQEGGESDAG